MSRAAGRGALRRRRRDELAGEAPSLSVGPSRSGRGVRRLRGKRWDAATSRSRGARRRARSSMRETRDVGAEGPPDWGGGEAPGAVEEVEWVDGASETPGTADAMETERDLRAVWVNGAVGEPQLVGPAGSVWVTGNGEEEEAVCRSPPRGSERKGRPGSAGSESVLELWLKVQAMRAASGCGEGSRVELLPVPAGEGPVERGVPGRASWLETSRRGLTGPWVKGQSRASTSGAGGSTALGLRALCRRVSDLCGQSLTLRLPLVGMRRHREPGARSASHSLGRGPSAGAPGAVEERSNRVAPASRSKVPVVGVSRAMRRPGPVEVPQAVEVPRVVGLPRAVEVSRAAVEVPQVVEEPRAMELPQALEVPQAVAVPRPVGVPRAVAVPRPVEVPRAVGIPRGVGVPRTLGIPRAVTVPQHVEEAIDGIVGAVGSRGAPDLLGRGHLVQVPEAVAQVAICGDVPSLWRREQPMEPPDAVEEEAASVGAPGMWPRGQAVEETDSEGVPRLWGTGQRVGIPPCTVEEQRGGEPGSRARGQALWAEETDSGGDPGPWGAPQTVQVPGPEEQEGGPGDSPDHWDLEQAVEVPQVSEREGSYGGVSDLWETEQAVVVPRAGAPGLWDGQQAEAEPMEVGEETQYENVQSSVQRQQPLGEQEALVPPSLGIRGSAGQEAGYGGISCLCRRRQALGFSETEGLFEAAGVPQHSRALTRPPTGMALPRSARVPARVPASVLASNPLHQESTPGDVLNPWERVHFGRVPTASGAHVTPEELWSVAEDAGSAAFPGRAGRSQAVGPSATARVSLPPELPGLVEEETDFGTISRSWGRRQSARASVAAEGPTAPRVSGPLGMETGPGSLPGRRQTVRVAVATGVPSFGGLSAAPRTVLEETNSRGIVDLPAGRQTVRPLSARRVSDSVEEAAFSEDIFGLSGRREVVQVPVAARVHRGVQLSMTAVTPDDAPTVGGFGSGDVAALWGRRPVTEVLSGARAPGPLEGEPGSEGVSGQRRRLNGGSGAVRVPLPLGVLAAIGVPMTGRLPAAVWVTGSAGEDVDMTIPGLVASRRQSVENSGEEAGDRNISGPTGRTQAVGVSYPSGQAVRPWSYTRSGEEETDYENAPGMAGTRATAGVSEAVDVPSAPREETDTGHFRGHPQQSGRRGTGGVSRTGVRGSNLGENFEGEDRSRGRLQK